MAKEELQSGTSESLSGRKSIEYPLERLAFFMKAVTKRHKKKPRLPKQPKLSYLDSKNLVLKDQSVVRTIDNNRTRTINVSTQDFF